MRIYKNKILFSLSIIISTILYLTIGYMIDSIIAIDYISIIFPIINIVLIYKYFFHKEKIKYLIISALLFIIYCTLLFIPGNKCWGSHLMNNTTSRTVCTCYGIKKHQLFNNTCIWSVWEIYTIPK